MLDAATIAPCVERELDVILTGIEPPALGEAMRYAVLGSGKRVRPTLCLLAAEAVGGDPTQALPAACAIELIHAYSLVHDDLPAMDNARTRRGKSSCHAAFGHAQAILAGDALLTLAFQVIAERTPDGVLAARIAAEIASAAGWAGLVGGQWDDLRNDKMWEDVARRKTAAFIRCALVCGGLAGQGNAAQIGALDRFGDSFGLLFQLTDDLLDGDGAVRSIGPDGARREAERLAAVAKAELALLRDGGTTLATMVDRVLQRAC